ncbi:MAG: hypothetical protein P4L40_24540 [Terracidiphilus sp.]|nr:hypothetical protein [Terracidiphilus sp.]
MRVFVCVCVCVCVSVAGWLVVCPCQPIIVFVACIPLSQVASLSQQLEWERSKTESLAQDNLRLLALLHGGTPAGSPKRAPSPRQARAQSPTSGAQALRLQEQLDVYKLALAQRDKEIAELKVCGRVCSCSCSCVCMCACMCVCLRV